MTRVVGGSGLPRAAPLSEVAYEHIRAELLEHGEAAFGGRLVEHQVAAQLALSRTPVRDALRRLHLAGWLRALPGGGFGARRSTMRDVLDTFELRLLLEPLAAALVARRGGLAEYLSDDADEGVGLHLAVASACGVDALATSIRSLLEAAMVAKHGGGSVRFEEDHADIRAAIQAGDARQAQELMRVHLLRVRDDRIASVAQTSARPAAGA